MLTNHYVFTQRPLGSLTDWQDAIDADGFPVRLGWAEGSLLTSALVHAALSNGPTTFKLNVSHPREVVRPWHAGKVPDSWAHAVALQDADTDLSAFTVTLAALSYGARCGGVIYCPDGEQTLVTRYDILKSEFSQAIGFYLGHFGLAPSARHP